MSSQPRLLGRSGRLVAATLALVLLASVDAAASDGGKKPPPGYVGSEEVPSGVHPGTPQSGFAGNDVNAPTIAAQDRTFGQVAARSGIGLQTYVYDAEHANSTTLDVYTPRAIRGRHGKTVRTVMMVHGGAWQMGDRVDLEAKAVQLVKNLGVIVVSVNYRLATAAEWPAQRDDVNAAVNFVRINAKKLNVDTKRIVLLGSSAGGQIAANVATMGAGKKRFKGLVTLSGLVNPLLMAEQDPGYSNGVIPGMLLRCLPVNCPEKYATATAMTSLDAKDMPSLLFHSRFEVPWDPTQARQFARASRALGVPSTLVVLEGYLHGVDAWKQDWPTLKKWLVERLGATDRKAK